VVGADHGVPSILIVDADAPLGLFAEELIKHRGCDMPQACLLGAILAKSGEHAGDEVGAFDLVHFHSPVHFVAFGDHGTNNTNSKCNPSTSKNGFSEIIFVGRGAGVMLNPLGAAPNPQGGGRR